MDSLISKRSLDEFYLYDIFPLVQYGMGSINDILEMRMYEIREANVCTKDRDFQKNFAIIHGLEVK